jgi:hypothetical protein
MSSLSVIVARFSGSAILSLWRPSAIAVNLPTHDLRRTEATLFRRFPAFMLLGSMAVKFELSPADYLCLRQKVSPQSTVYVPLLRAASHVRVENRVSKIVYAVECSEDDAARLLAIARLHCPDAVPVLEEAMKASRQ